MAGRRKLIIDSDTGVDDANAIFMALNSPDVDVIGITTVSGNATAPQSGRNVLRVLQVANRLTIPVFVGCSEPLLGDVKPRSDYHGSDGFGDAPDPQAPDDSHLQPEHAVQALIRLSKEHVGEISLVCIGPLTNIALAIRMDPQFGRRLKHCYIMGGNYEGKGNMTVSAEFNFYFDPEAAYVVLNQLQCPITLMPWEVCDRNSLSWDFYHRLRETSTPKSDFLKKIEQKSAEYAKVNHWGNFVPADEVLMAAVVNHDVITKAVDVYATVEVKGQYTWGQMVVDWNSVLKKPKSMKLVTEIDHSKYTDLLFKAVDKTPV